MYVCVNQRDVFPSELLRERVLLTLKCKLSAVWHTRTLGCVCALANFNSLQTKQCVLGSSPCDGDKERGTRVCFSFLRSHSFEEREKKHLLWLCFFDFYLLTEVPYGICKGETVCTMQ